MYGFKFVGICMREANGCVGMIEWGNKAVIDENFSCYQIFIKF